MDIKKEATRVSIDDQRFYLIDGQYYPSVTTILGVFPKGQHLNKWIAEHGWLDSQRLKTIAAEKGTIVHNSIERLIDKETLEYRNYEEDEWTDLRAFTNFWEDYKPETTAYEHTIYSKVHSYAGTLDWAGYITMPNGERVFARLDWKTSNYIYDEYELQLVAYDVAEIENGKPPADVLLIVQLGTKTKRGYSIRTITKKEEAFTCFQHVYAIWKYVNPNAKPYQKEVPLFLSLHMSNSSSTSSPSKDGQTEPTLPVQSSADTSDQPATLSKPAKVSKKRKTSSKKLKSGQKVETSTGE